MAYNNREDYYKRCVLVLEKLNNGFINTHIFRVMLRNSGTFFRNVTNNNVALANFFNSVQTYSNTPVFDLNDLFGNTGHGIYMSEYLYFMLVDSSFNPHLWIRFGDI